MNRVNYNIVQTDAYSIDLVVSVNPHVIRDYDMNNGGLGRSVKLDVFMNVRKYIPSVTNEDGSIQRGQFDRNNSFMITKTTLPIFLEELELLNVNMKTPELFRYVNDKLEVNYDLQDKFSSRIQIHRNSIEIKPTVIVVNDREVEGVSLKINTDNNIIDLNINNLILMIYHLKNTDMDILGLSIYHKLMR